MHTDAMFPINGTRWQSFETLADAEAYRTEAKRRGCITSGPYLVPTEENPYAMPVYEVMASN